MEFQKQNSKTSPNLFLLFVGIIGLAAVMAIIAAFGGAVVILLIQLRELFTG